MASSHAQSVDRLIGRIVDTNYIVEEKLGEGGMGAVYRCRHRHFAGDYVALKVLSAAAPGAQGATQNLIDRFLQEARAASLVASKRVVQMYGAGQFEDGSGTSRWSAFPGAASPRCSATTGRCRCFSR